MKWNGLVVLLTSPPAISILLSACIDVPAGSTTTNSADAACAVSEADGGTQSPPPDMSATRTLRRMTLALSDHLPTLDELRELQELDPAAQETWLAQEADRLLANPRFYDTMFELGRRWMPIPYVPNAADAPEYFLPQQQPIVRCPDGTAHAGRWAAPDPYRDMQPCNGLNADGTTAIVRTVEPWWAEGTMVEVVGHAGDDRVMLEEQDCGARLSAQFFSQHHNACGCGPNLIFCNPSFRGTDLAQWQEFVTSNPKGNRRLAQEEAARLFAHIAWHDRPLTDLIAGTYSVGPVEVQANYVRFARRLGAVELDANQSWWRSSRWTAPVDPHHESTDPWAWSEFEVPTRNPYLLGDRDYHFDPRVEASGTMRGIPAAGVLTMPGVLGALTRERVRGARFLEMFACENFVPPPADAEFDPYTNDPATGGNCMYCHTRIDPASIHFRRFMRVGGRLDIFGVGSSHYEGWETRRYPYGGDPFERMARLWSPETKMTPVDEATATMNPESRWIDFLPPDQTLYGQISDGTVGPLGFAKLIVDSGLFDRCAVRRMHEQVIGRDINPTTESGYLESLTRVFKENDRRVRPFIRHLLTSAAFRGGF